MATTDNKTKARELVIGLFFSALFLVIAGKVVFLHATSGPWLSEKAMSQSTRQITSEGRRGTIYDRNKRELAVSLDAISLSAFPEKINNHSDVAKKLADILGISSQIIYRKLSSGDNFVWLKRQISYEKTEAIKALKIQGLAYTPDTKRYYPGKTLAGQVVGFTGIDGSGLEGLEFLNEAVLAPGQKKHVYTRDALGRDIGHEEADLSGINGNSLVLTLDSTIQYIAEEALASAARQYQAASGIAVVMAPDSGAVLAMAHYPEFNPNSFKDYNSQIWRNRAVTDPFEPGSTLKLFLAAAALETGKCNPDTIFYCENGSYNIGSHRVNDSHPYDWLSLQQIIKYSSNIGAVKISDVTGREQLFNTLANFGFGKKTGVECPGETTGILSSYQRWTKIDTGAIAFGQGVSVSAIQLVSAVSTIANGGFRVNPYMIDEIIAPSGDVIKKYRPAEARRIVSGKTSETMKRIMATVVTEGGTGVNAALKNYRVCGKTGTAQKISNTGTYSKDEYIASFVGFAPQKNPAITVLVVLDGPKNNYYGGTVAAPTFREIVYKTLDYMNIEPEIYTNNGKILYAKRTEEDR